MLRFLHLRPSRRLSLAVTLLLAFPAAALAGPLELCAELAASPYQPGYKKTGVEANAVDWPAAKAACTAATIAEPASVEAKAWLARVYYVGGKYADALPYAEPAAAGGDAMAQQLLGDILVVGMGGVPADEPRGIELLQASAAAGYAMGQNSLAISYENGEGVTADPARAAELYQAAAAQGLGEAEVNLGRLYAGGTGVAEDDAKAFALFQSAAAKGHPQGWNGMGVSYEYGEGTVQDYALAMEAYHKALDGGAGIAAGNIAYLYVKGFGVERDFAQALQWARQSNEGMRDYGQYLLDEKQIATTDSAPLDAAVAAYEAAMVGAKTRN